jgi:hypothetical protein
VGLRWKAAMVALGVCSMATAAQEISAPNDHGQTVQIRVDAQADEGPLRPVWSYIGYDEPNFTREKWKEAAKGRTAAAKCFASADKMVKRRRGGPFNPYAVQTETDLDGRELEENRRQRRQGQAEGIRAALARVVRRVLAADVAHVGSAVRA